MAYRLVGADNGAAKVEWLGSSTATASTLFASHERDDERTERDEAAEWLIDYLEANDGAAIAGAAIKAAAAVGIAKTTLTRARKRAGVVSVKAGMKGRMDLESRSPKNPRRIRRIRLSGRGFFGPFGGFFAVPPRDAQRRPARRVCEGSAQLPPLRDGGCVMSSATERVDPRCCQSCRTTEAPCDSKRLFRSARCCDNCDHDNAVVAFEQLKSYILTVWSVVLLDEVDEWFMRPRQARSGVCGPSCRWDRPAPSRGADTGMSRSGPGQGLTSAQPKGATSWIERRDRDPSPVHLRPNAPGGALGRR